MTKHISELQIKSYRGISDLSLQDLGSINILVGDNNSGKTSVLEILQSVEAPANIQLWRKIARHGVSMVYRGTLFDNLAFLVNPDSDQGSIEYRYKMHDNDFNVHIAIDTEDIEMTMSELDKMGVRLQIPLSMGTRSGKEQADMLIPDLKQLTMGFLVNGEQGKSYVTFNIADNISRGDGTQNTPIDITYVSPVQHADERFSLSKVFNNPRLYQEMLEVLKDFDPGIIAINADKTDNAYSGRVVYKILSQENETALPLSVYGDGMKKAILLMSSAVATANGILLIDEFETAIHTTAMSNVFHWILSTCQKLNIQLFMTTHSQEALDKLLESSGELLPDIRVIRLKKKDGKTMARTLSGVEALADRKTYNMELRT